MGTGTGWGNSDGGVPDGFGPPEYHGNPFAPPGSRPAGPPPGPYGTPAPPVPPPARWQAPSPVERQLYEAKTRGDWSGYFDVLGRNWLYTAQRRAFLDAHPGEVQFLPHFSPQVGGVCLTVLTEGVLPAPVADPVYSSASLSWYADAWDPTDPPWLAVNPGTPSEAYFLTTPEHRARWKRHTAAEIRPGLRLRALHVGGALHGTVAHGLACGALLSVNNGELWNALGYHGRGYRRERTRLQEWWDITTPEEWRDTLERLLSAEMVSPVWEFALRVRRGLALDFGGAVELDHWRTVAERVVRRNAERAAEPRITPEGVTPGTPADEGEVSAQAAGVRRLIGRIARYEARFRADGLLEDGRFIRTLEAWDYGRASGMARWGLAARFGTLAETEAAVVRASSVARANYRSWEEFSAAYILGRCLHFDEEEFGDWYENALACHRILTTDPASPWLNIPWK
ncbi:MULTISPECIES: DUF1266 domain-containing protein [Streptomyces]|uniref:DUF1266 domain-containing protein n=1 Tax=Streptomyces tsukubensis (strain DSM 42081 / NBRC 108919 / NRRL 18488 / 9993) TaxID=1114943 RepID=I2N1L1_STRT9|nr:MULTISPECIES: DUF1266 domain-containing protein [Streptomyces]AZK95074.1 hypothetical protein B7R87_15320 [Streptomyces tsukubensis]EIF90908.1 hypothetical protein [Streptomyces tsukubensis NRRL18488]MYS63201.1 DUF1266 domain-containing protein [Streptomyces sp. SID5473]QKM68861.1 DUF1266 domain-containing protein [Streptomyces tsukubensis NRRL18488]TAI43665.1 DUF1266 domain-containing protein [Streptomyces tsukubensis]